MHRFPQDQAVGYLGKKDLLGHVLNSLQANEFLRLQHRYLDLRSEVLQRNLKFRSAFILTIRQFLCLSYGKQLDLELSFANAADIMRVVEDLLLHVWPLVRDIRKDHFLLQTPFPKMTYSAAISQFGSDKPDIRFPFRFCEPSRNGSVGFKIPSATVSLKQLIPLSFLPS
ncbi:uncharacterized protein DEA37_0012269 [Paragonimus westermani]|uniref:Aminoacyl-tRNA synthetase class II (D/K/N) domain-containing protein n=1 Tax=Paragonimus westermani TaxID=34504 RepID=A0A5J4N9U9_9TREM|nr:uncharacterized protein DEA37_0012269 [Paragonimus westermani]